MTHFEKVQVDMYAAMKSGEKEKANTLRNVLSKLKDKQIEKRETLSIEEEIKILKNEIDLSKEKNLRIKAEFENYKKRKEKEFSLFFDR